MRGGASIDQASNNGCTPLYVASSQGHLEVVRELVRGGASINQASNDGRTSLFIASSQGHVEVVRELLTAGADHTLVWNIDDQSKETPLRAGRR